jgi:hypothetical protein
VDVGSLHGVILLLETKLHESSPLIKRHVGELVVAEGVGRLASIVGVDQIIVVGEVLKHGHEVLAVLEK